MKILIPLLLFLLAGCSIAPLDSPKTATTLEEGKIGVDAGISPDLYARVYRGMGNNFELGGMLSYQLFPILSLTGKYSIINNPEGMSLAAFTGLFYALDSVSSQGFFIGPIISHRKDWLEVYSSIRYNWVNWKISNLAPDELDDLFFDFADTRFSYLQYELGFNFWVSEKVAINVSGKYIHFYESDIDEDGSFLPGLSLIINNW